MTGGAVKPFAPHNPTVWTGERMKKFFNDGDIALSQIQPNGIDITIDKVFRQIGNPSLSHDPTYTDKGDLMQIVPLEYAGLKNNGWFLTAGYYIVQWAEKIRIPDTAIGLISSRSTMLRIGGWIIGAVWDKGYEGKGRSGLNVYNDMLIEHGMRLAQMIFIDAQKGDTYEGQYQKENLEEDTK